MKSGNNKRVNKYFNEYHYINGEETIWINEMSRFGLSLSGKGFFSYEFTENTSENGRYEHLMLESSKVQEVCDSLSDCTVVQDRDGLFCRHLYLMVHNGRPLDYYHKMLSMQTALKVLAYKLLVITIAIALIAFLYLFGMIGSYFIIGSAELILCIYLLFTIWVYTRCHKLIKTTSTNA